MAELLEWGPCYTLWANAEDQLAGALLTMSKALDECVRTVKELVSLLVFLFFRFFVYRRKERFYAQCTFNSRSRKQK